MKFTKIAALRELQLDFARTTQRTRTSYARQRKAMEALDLSPEDIAEMMKFLDYHDYRTGEPYKWCASKEPK
jgi:hypothetical protein